MCYFGVMILAERRTREPRERPTVGVRDLKQNASKIVAELEADHEPRIITVNGRPVAGLVPLESMSELVFADAVVKTGLAFGLFAERMASFPVAAMSDEQASAWANDVRESDGADELPDPWERAGL